MLNKIARAYWNWRARKRVPVMEKIVDIPTPVNDAIPFTNSKDYAQSLASKPGSPLGIVQEFLQLSQLSQLGSCINIRIIRIDDDLYRVGVRHEFMVPGGIAHNKKYESGPYQGDAAFANAVLEEYVEAVASLGFYCMPSSIDTIRGFSELSYRNAKEQLSKMPPNKEKRVVCFSELRFLRDHVGSVDYLISSHTAISLGERDSSQQTLHTTFEVNKHMVAK